jgi:hypothetical protein
LFTNKIKKWLIVQLSLPVLVIGSWSAGFCGTINVGTVSELKNAVASANSSGGNTTIILRDATYTLNDTLYINAPHVTIRSQSGIRKNVIIRGDAMSSSARVGNILRVAGSNFEISNVTLQRCGWHIIQITGVDNPTIRNCVLGNSYEQILKVSDEDISDNGLVENCLFEYTAGIGPQYYIGGVDAHRARNWIVRNNVFRNIISPNTTVAEFAVHFWGNSTNNLVEKNLIINCDRGVGFGLDGRGNTGGTIRNNMIYHANNKGSYADASIVLTDSPDTKVYNNTIYAEHDFPWAIEYRFSSTRNVLIVNNITNKPITSRDGGSGTVTNNVTNAAENWFVEPMTGDLHLALAISAVVDSGQTVSGLSDDFDGQSRPQGSGIDIGADEYSANIVIQDLQAPKNLHIVNQ